MALICPQCGAEVSAEATACEHCHVELPRSSGERSEPLFEAVWCPDSSPRGASFVGSVSRLAASCGAAAETAVRFVLRPEASFGAFRFTGRVGPATLYSILLGGPSLLLGVVITNAAWLTDLPAPTRTVSALSLVLLAPPLYVYLRAQLLHLTLVLTDRAVHPFPATFRLVAYANASVAPVLLIPFVGDFVFLVLGAAVETIGLRWCHSLTPRQAFAAELLPVSILLLCLASAAVLGILWWSQASGQGLGLSAAGSVFQCGEPPLSLLAGQPA